MKSWWKMTSLITKPIQNEFSWCWKFVDDIVTELQCDLCYQLNQGCASMMGNHHLIDNTKYATSKIQRKWDSAKTHLESSVWVQVMACLPGGTKPLPEPVLTYHQCSPVTFIWGHFIRGTSAEPSTTKINFKNTYIQLTLLSNLPVTNEFNGNKVGISHTWLCFPYPRMATISCYHFAWSYMAIQGDCFDTRLTLTRASMEGNPWQLQCSLTLRLIRNCCHFDEIIVTGCTGSGVVYGDNFAKNYNSSRSVNVWDRSFGSPLRGTKNSYIFWWCYGAISFAEKGNDSWH